MVFRSYQYFDYLPISISTWIGRHDMGGPTLWWKVVVEWLSWWAIGFCVFELLWVIHQSHISHLYPACEVGIWLGNCLPRTVLSKWYGTLEIILHIAYCILYLGRYLGPSLCGCAVLVLAHLVNTIYLVNCSGRVLGVSYIIVIYINLYLPHNLLQP